ncbi:hypothetical protein [Klebsiella pneumoniae]|uniref:hypothetical protein n=1 Tax=Klebsiella pneumoniae TaxID=573 RepID=UPI002B4B9945|nr:hypothetical protein [Klebsiella pneumoniae]
MKTQPATGETYPKSDLFNKASPFVRKSERVGERKRYELHHLKRIKDDGAVYDVD